jgi:hypothetical protein
MIISEEIIVASIAALGVVLSALITGLFTLTFRKIKDIHIEVNSWMSQMLLITQLAAEAVGVKKEHDRAAAEAAAVDKIN